MIYFDLMNEQRQFFLFFFSKNLQENKVRCVEFDLRSVYTFLSFFLFLFVASLVGFFQRSEVR